jgi:hypothetical protein
MKWPSVIDAARDIVESYDTWVTLRQLFYRLVSRALILNSDYHYKRLSELTAEGRRQGTFPDLIDNTRWIRRYQSFGSPRDALDYTKSIYRRDRTEGQNVSPYLGTEKAGIIAQFEHWFGDLGIPILPLGGFSSQTFVKDVVEDVRRQERPAVLLYAGDFDASGVMIDRVFEERTNCWVEKPTRVVLNPGQVTEYDLVRQEGKPKDPNVAAFVDRYGDEALFDPDNPYVTVNGKPMLLPVQVELDALDPNDLRRLFQAEIDRHWDESQYERVLAREFLERRSL